MRRGRRGRPTNDGPVAPARSCSGYEPRAPARRRWYLTVSRPPIRATEQPRKHTRAHAHTHTRASAIAPHRYGPRFRANLQTAPNTLHYNIIIYYREVVFYRLAADPRRTRLRSRLYARPTAVRAYTAAADRFAPATATLGRYPREYRRNDVVSIVIATLTRRKHFAGFFFFFFYKCVCSVLMCVKCEIPSSF